MSDLVLFNSLTRSKQRFEPLSPDQVSLYVCGVTVYDLCHLGHARSLIAFDVLVRHLRASGYQVNYVRNITDVDDKIIARAQQTHQAVSTLTMHMIDAFHQDMAALGLLQPSHEPRATAHIDDIVALIETLEHKGFAYQGKRGDVYFDVMQFTSYGQLSRKDIDGQQAGLRIDVADDKRHPLDFVLWKTAKEDEIAWYSPWGEGRPGWHIECSAMCRHCLGQTIDIHGGGFDLQFPHHENEIAQSEAANGQPLARFWMHTGFLNINQQKMSKSLGNFLSIRDALKTYHPDVLKLFFLSGHYRKPIDFNETQLTQAKSNMQRFYRVIADTKDDLLQEPKFCQEAESFQQSFNAAMNDDLNTPQALAILFEMAKASQAAHHGEHLVSKLVELGRRLGLFSHSAEAFFDYNRQADGLSDQMIEDMLEQRNQARRSKEWQLADRIRQQLLDNHIEISDADGETRWRRI